MNQSLFKLASITKKITISIIGLFLAVFLLIHMGINLLTICPIREHFDSAVEFMGSPVMKIMEIVLFTAFILHIFVAIILWYQNKQARPIAYARSNESKTSFMSKYMIHTGMIILIFLILHFTHFFFVKLGFVEGIMNPVSGEPDFYTITQNLFNSPLYSIIYLISFLALGFHLNHAIQAGFQSLGLNHTRYTPCIKKFSTIYAILITIGFASIPLYFLFF